MKDEKTLERIKLLHPKLRDEALEMYDDIVSALSGYAACRFAYTLRTFAEQDALYAQGRSKPGAKVTNAKGGQSYQVGTQRQILTRTTKRIGLKLSIFLNDTVTNGVGIGSLLICHTFKKHLEKQ